MVSEADRKSGDSGVLKAKHRKCINEEGVINWVRATKGSVWMRTCPAVQRWSATMIRAVSKDWCSQRIDWNVFRGE